MPLDRFQSIDPRLLEIEPEHRVIDLGCGTGRHVLELSKRPSTLLGADISRHDLRIGRFLVEVMRRRQEVQARVHWLQTAAAGLYVVYNDTETINGLGPVNRALILKFSQQINLLR